ncbi:hypothetical protein KY285_002924 [Solanum tuberosum]|nr:hypothetical protein KY285_002924 [Solanum tuberosum]
MTRGFSQINSVKTLKDRFSWRVATLGICIHPGQGIFIGPILLSVSAVASIPNLGCGAEKGNGYNGALALVIK